MELQEVCRESFLMYQGTGPWVRDSSKWKGTDKTLIKWNDFDNAKVNCLKVTDKVTQRLLRDVECIQKEKSFRQVFTQEE